MDKSRLYSLLIFVFGLCAFIGVESFQDFYFDLKSKTKGELVNYAQFSQFCGNTGALLPGESDWDYRLRIGYNMLSAMMAMVVFATVLVGGLIGLVFLSFYALGTFR